MQVLENVIYRWFRTLRLEKFGENAENRLLPQRGIREYNLTMK